MQHHGAPSRILDWSDGDLIGLHFAVGNTPAAPDKDVVVFVLQPYWLLDHLKSLPDYDHAKEKWQVFCRENPSDYSDDEWDVIYLPQDEEARNKMPLPGAPLLWDTAQITRRFGAQRSRFMLFGTNPYWMQEIADNHDAVKVLTIPAQRIPEIKYELREAGITESVIFPDLDGLGRELMQKWEERR
jgi:hypothetical protein